MGLVAVPTNNTNGMGAAYEGRVASLTGSLYWKTYYQGFQNTLANPGRTISGSGNAGTFLANKLQVSTTALANDEGSYTLRADATTANQPQYELGTNAEFYTEILMQTDFAANAQAMCGLCGLNRSTAQLSLGFDGSISTTQWSLKIDAVTLVGGTYAANTWVRLGFCRKSGLTTFYVNGVAVATNTSAFFGATQLTEFGIKNGSSAIARNGYLSEFAIAHPSPRASFP